MRHSIIATLSIALAVALVGCGKNEEPVKANTASVDTAKDAEPAEKTGQYNDPKGDTSVPLEQYKPLTSSKQVLGHYVRLAGVPEDISAIASSFAPEIAMERDAFKRRDLEAKFRETLTQEAQSSKDSIYFWIDMSAPNAGSRPVLYEYDFEKKAFPVPDLWIRPLDPHASENMKLSYRLMNKARGRGIDFNPGNTMVLFTNSNDYQFLPVTDETLARRIEDERSKYTQETVEVKEGGGIVYKTVNHLPFSVRVYGFANAADAKNSGTTVRAQIMKLQLIDKDGKVLAEK